MKRIIFIITVIVSLVIISQLLNSIFSLWNKKDIVLLAQKELMLEQKKNAKLKQDLATVSKSDFVEEEARNKLFLIKPGEKTIVIPDALLKKVNEESKPLVQKPNWQQWWELFF